MPEGVITTDGKPVDLAAADRDFSASMAAPSADEPMAPAPPKLDPDAPYGLKADGTPRQRPAGPGRGRKTTRNTDSKPPAPAAKQTSETPQAASQRRTEGIQGLAQIGAGLCLAVGKARKSEAFKADAMVLAQNAEPLAQACASIAADNVAFAAAIDKITAVGPYGALIAVAVPMVTQLVRNHRPGMTLPGTADPKDLVARLEAATEQPEAQAA